MFYFLFYFIPLICDMDLKEARKYFFEIQKSRYRIYYQQSTMWILIFMRMNVSTWSIHTSTHKHTHTEKKGNQKIMRLLCY